MVIRNLSTHAVLADHAELADGFLSRLTGLLSRSSLGEGGALMFPRCRSIHTCFMRFPIDVLFLKTAPGSKLQASSKNLQPAACSLQLASSSQPTRGVVVKLVHSLRPFRVVWAADADTVIECPAGTVLRTDTKAGELLEIA